MAIYFTSDLHFGHNREFVYKPRGFNSIEEHDEALIKNWNEMITDEDEVYILGDLMLGDNAHGIECLNRLAGKKHYIIGNHDTARRIELYAQNGIICDGYASYLKYNGYHLYLSHYPTMTGNLEKESLKQCTCNLFGHTHQKTLFYQDMPFMYNVGVDAHDCHPVLIDAIIADMNCEVRKCKEYL